MSFVEKLITPSFYQKQFNGFVQSSATYYKPMFRAGSITPLWHFMAITSVVMYTATYVGHKKKGVDARRAEQKLALEEYYAKHGKSGHH